MKTTIECAKRLIFLFITLAALCAAAAIALVVQGAYAVSADEVDYTFETVPAESITLSVGGDISEIQPRQSFTVYYEVDPWYTTTSRIFLDVFPQSAATVTEESEIKLAGGKARGSAQITVCADAVVGSAFRVVASADGIESNSVVLTVVKIPVTGITLSSVGTDDKLHIGKTRTVTHEFSPSYATVKDVEYELAGSGVEYIESFDETTGTIKAKGGITEIDVNAAVTVTVRSTDNPNAFDSVTFSLFIPTTVVEISATTPLGRATADGAPLAVANSINGDTVGLHAKLNGVDSTGLNYVIVNGREYVENGVVRSDGTFTLRPTSNWSAKMRVPHPEVRIRAAYSDGFDEITVAIYIPVERIAFVGPAPTSVENFRSYDLAVETFPEYATQSADNEAPILYSLNGIDSGIAYISDGGLLRLPKSLTSKGSVISFSASLVGAWVGVDSAPLRHELTIAPVYATAFKSITVLKNGASISSYGVNVLPSDTLRLETEYTTDNVTDIDVTLVENSSLLSTNGQTITIAQLSAMNANHPNVDITVRYSHGGRVFSEAIIIPIYVPAESAIIKDATFNRGEPLDLTRLITINGHGYATNRGIEWGAPTVYGGGVGVTADCKDGLLGITSNANAGTVVRVPYRTYDRDEWQYKEFTVAPLFGTFTLEYGKTVSSVDSREYDIDYDAPQLEQGQSVKLYLKFNGVGAAKRYGLSYSVRVSGDNATLEYTGGDFERDVFDLCARSGQRGRNNYIGFVIIVRDGTNIYYVYTDGEAVSASDPSLRVNGIAIFKRINGNIDVAETAVSEKGSFTLTGWDDDATFDADNLTWSVSGGKTDRNTIVAAPLSGFVLTISAAQTYNGVDVAFSKEIAFRSVLYYNGTTLVKQTYVKQGESVILAGKICTKTDHMQIGWSVEDGGALEYAFYGEYADSADLTLYAKWTPLRYETHYYGETTVTDKNVYSYRDVINPMFDIGIIRSLGYTEIIITVVFDCKEINDGYQDVRVFSGSDDNRIGDRTVEHGAGHKDTSWWSHTLVFDVSLDSFASNNAAFYIGWGAHGGLGDDWSLGTRTITVAAA